MGMSDDNEDNNSVEETDRRARAMKDGLRKDVEAWSANRSGSAVRAADDFRVPRTPVAPQPAARRVKKPKPVADVAPTPQRNKPFSMSYDGETTAQHIATRVARGAR